VVRRQVTVAGSTGLHARPAALFCREAARFAARVTLEKDGRHADGRSLLSVLELDVRQGETIVLVAEGADEDEAVMLLAGALERP
jgi:phosphotransferase system HPr (HPr) family protein